MQMNDINIDENEIDIKALLHALYRYNLLILLMVILFGLGSAYYAYFKPDIYRATASVKVGLDSEAYAKDVISMAMGKGALNSATEKDLIKSRYLAKRALKNVDFRYHYYVIKDFKEVELYKKSPLTVHLTDGYDISFNIEVLDRDTYILNVQKAIRDDGTTWEYKKTHHFDTLVSNDDFNLTLFNTDNIQQGEYRFVVDKKNRSFGKVFVSQNSENSTILQISVEDTVALRAKEYANALAEAYVKQNVENKTREANQRLIFIDAQLNNISLRIKDAAGKLEDFRKTSKIVHIDNKTEALSDRLDEHEANLMDLVIKEEMLKNFYKEVKSNRKLETLSIEGIEDKESVLSDMMKELHETILEQRLLKQDYTNLHPVVIKVKRKIAQLKSVIMNTVSNLIKNLEKRKNFLSKNIKRERELLNSLPENVRHYGQLERKFKMNEEISSYLLKRKSEAEMVKASTVSKNRLLDRALVSSSPIKPKRKIIVLIGLLIGFIVGIILAFLSILLDTKIKNESDISQLVSYPTLGVIPRFDDEGNSWKSEIKVFASAKSPLAEAFRHLRSNLQFLRKRSGSQLILITSTIGQEGKTTISVNVGAIMSLAKKRTIIINLDMRKPTLHEKFDLPNSQGLSELLNDRVGLKDVIQETRYPYLDIISSGVIPPNPSELIQSKKMYEILHELKQGYDFILLDTPPIGLVTDAKELMHFADINIYIVRADYSRKEFLENLKTYDFMRNVSHMGIVLNDVKPKKGGYGYYADYGYYDEKSK